MKRGIKTIACCVMALGLAGCGSFPNLSEEEATRIGEYAAVTLLKYDANSRSRLVDLSKIEMESTEENASGQQDNQTQAPVTPESSQKPEDIEHPESPSSENPSPEKQESGKENMETVGSMEEFLELPQGMTVGFAGYDVCQSYQEDSTYFALEASEGKLLLVARFELQNASGSDQDIDFLAGKSNYRITVNGNYTRTALMTMLSNDMSTYVGTVGNGGTEELVLLIEIPAGDAEAIQSISLNLKNASKTYTIQLI